MPLMKRSIREFEPEQLIGMTWKFPGEPLSQVRITRALGTDSTRLTLTHDGFGTAATAYLPG
jgi:uncharacterized protein YndB with AHSA1/START domain